MALSEVTYRPPRLQSARLLLRGYEASDAEAVFAYASDDEATRYMAWDRHRTIDDTRTFLDGYLARAYRTGAAEYAICERDNPACVVGGIGLRVTSELHQNAELGYVLNREVWGQGYAVEAGQLLLAHTFANGGIERVNAPILADNARSRRVAEKLGFSLEGVLRSAWLLRGRRWDEAHYALLRAEWQSAGAAVAASTPALPWLPWARQIAAIAQNGLTFSENPFDRQRYEALRALGLEIMERAIQPSAQTAAHVRRLLLAGATGYATPKLDVRGAVFRGEPDGGAQVLMVKERSDGGWTLPGGWVDVGESPSRAVEKEVREESGFEVRARKVIAVLDRDRQGHPAYAFHAWKVFVLCEIVGGGAHAHGDGIEIDAVAFFRRDELPPLSLTRILPRQIARCFAHYEEPQLPTEFD